jgi:hypothetical protein
VSAIARDPGTGPRTLVPAGSPGAVPTAGMAEDPAADLLIPADLLKPAAPSSATTVRPAAHPGHLRPSGIGPPPVRIPPVKGHARPGQGAGRRSGNPRDSARGLAAGLDCAAVAENFDPVAHNRAAWDREVDNDNEWTRPVGPDVIARARAGDWSVVLIGYEPVPRDWFPSGLAGGAVLCLASGGGQQGPVLAAAGAAVTVFDNSPAQLVVRHKVPFTTLELPDDERRRDYSDGPIEYSHSLTEQIGGQLAAGFTLTHFVEAPHHSDATGPYLPGYIATRAVRPQD